MTLLQEKQTLQKKQQKYIASNMQLFPQSFERFKKLRKFMTFKAFLFAFLVSNLFIASAACEARANPWSQRIIYFFIVDRFADGDTDNNFNVNKENLFSFHGGDLKGVLDRWPHFQELGVNTLLTTPLMGNRQTDFLGHWALHGYWIENPFELDRHLGIFADLEKIVAKKNQTKTNFILDLVTNHLAWDHPWINQHPDWFHPKREIVNMDDEKDATTGWLSGLPDLNQSVPEVFKHLVAYSKFWIEKTDANGIRLDAVKHIDHAFWRKYLDEMKKFAAQLGKSDFLILGEFLHGDQQKYLPYIEDGFNAFYDYPLYYSMADVFARNQSLMFLPSRLYAEEKVFSQIQLITFLDNHDMPRFLSLSDSVAQMDLRQALFFQFMIRGTPIVYSGTESMVKGTTGELGRQSLDFGDMPLKPYIKKLADIRTHSSALTEGTHENLMVTDTNYIFRRLSENQEAIVVISRTPMGQKLNLKLPKQSLFLPDSLVEGGTGITRTIVATDALADRNVIIKHGQMQLDLKPRDMMIFLKNGKIKKAPPRLTQKQVVFEYPLTNELAQDEQVYVVGNHAKLGHWNPSQGLGPMTKTQDHLEISALFTEREIFEYKFVRINSKKEVQWENSPNHVQFVSPK